MIVDDDAGARPMRWAMPLALETTLARPAWWAVAAAGFLARGGILLFLALLIEVPSPVTVTLIFGVDSVTGTGQPSDRLVTTIAAFALAVLAAALASVLIAALADAALFARVTNDRDGPPADPRVGGGRGGAREVLGLAWLQSLGLAPVIFAFAAAVPTIRDVAIGEFLLPSVPEVPFLVRVLEGAQGPLLRAIAVLAVAEAAVTVATRAYLGGSHGGSVAGSFVAAAKWMVRRPTATIVAWAAGWAALLGALAVGLWAVALAWGQLRGALLRPSLELTLLADVDPAASLPALGALLGPSLLFVTVWVAAIVLVGLASAFRSTLWTLAVAAPFQGPAVVRWRADAHA